MNENRHSAHNNGSTDNENRLLEFKGDQPMDILIRVAGVDLTDKLREAIRSKIGRVRRYAPEAFRARVQLQKSNPSPRRYRAHVLYELKGNDVSAQHRAHDPIVALGIVAEKIERRLRRRKTAYLASRVRDYRNRARARGSFARTH